MTFDYPEGATPIDPDEAEGLKLTHITTRAELDRWEQDNIVDALEWLDRTRPKNILNQAFMLKLHERMFGNIWKWAGKLRRSDKNIGGPWWRIQEDLTNVCKDVSVWIDEQTYTPDEVAARFHHRLVFVHLFPNGNGRHARLMADLLLENVLNQEQFTWGGENLAKAGACRKRYIASLHAADGGDYAPLLGFVRA